MLLLIFTAFVILLALNIPVAYSLMAVSIGYLVLQGGIPLIVVAQQVAAGTDKFLLLAIPFFFLAGEFMSAGGIATRLVEVARVWVGHWRGGHAHMNVVASILFGGISGSAVADMAALGRIEINMMRIAGYPIGFSAAITAASATVGPIIPPSIAMLVYGSITNTSVGQLFVAGFVPGIAMGLFMMVAITLMAKRRNFPREPWVGWGELARTMVRSIPVIMLPVIILGGIFGGLFTPTEAAIVAAAYALLVGLTLGELKIAALPSIFTKVAVDSAQIMFILVNAFLFGWILAREALPSELVNFVLSFSTEPWVFLLAVNILLLFLGLFMEPLAVMVIVVPLLMPAVHALEINTIHFGVVVVLNLMIGMVTPPVGMLMFLAMSIARISIVTFTREIWPFLVALLVTLGVVTYLPEVVLFVPRLFYN